MLRKFPPHITLLGRLQHYVLFVSCVLIYLFLMGPLLVIIPLSFNPEPYFTFTREMLTLQPEGFSLRWYEELFTKAEWKNSIKNSFFIAFFTTLLATALGTLAALGLSRRRMPYKDIIMAVLLSPMIVPIIVSASGVYLSFAKAGLSQSYVGLILAHTIFAAPYVVITVTAALAGYDLNLSKASSSLGASPSRTFFKITMPIIAPGIFSGALFAFITSFDEVVVTIFLASAQQRTLPRQMWAGINEEISPTILAAGVMLVLLSAALLLTMELLRRRSERMRGSVE